MDAAWVIVVTTVGVQDLCGAINSIIGRSSSSARPGAASGSLQPTLGTLTPRGDVRPSLRPSAITLKIVLNACPAQIAPPLVTMAWCSEYLV